MNAAESSTATAATVRVEGSLLPRDLLDRVAALDPELPGVKPADYGLAQRERVGEAIARSWSRLVAARAADPDERWMLLLFEELGWGRLQPTAPVAVGERTFPISHGTTHVPIHLVGAGVELGRSALGDDGLRRSPHGLVQELLNEADDRLWGLVANPVELRLLRDSAALSRQVFVAFDLESMFAGEQYADFALLWLVCHRTRFDGERPAESLIERWTQIAHERGIRALEALRAGVEKAMLALGTGFLADRDSDALRAAITDGSLSAKEYERELLRLVYRLIVLFVAEDRGVLHPATATPKAVETYATWFSTGRLRRMARTVRGGVHGDLWESLRLVLTGLGKSGGLPELGLPALGGLFDADQTPHLDAARIANEQLLNAVRCLSTTREKSRGGAEVLRAVDYRNLASEELGSVYESLLELRPSVDLAAWEFRLDMVPGSDRKTTGSYYTPSSLIDLLLDEALDPLIDQAAAKPDATRALLELTVCDPACGSGHFLVAAAQRIGSRLARVRAGEAEPSPEEVRHALRDVVERCIFGVDLNPMAVELCKVALWLEALDADRPLSFLDHHIRWGNALLGTTPDLIAAGVPNGAYAPLTGDDKAVVSEHRRKNAVELKRRKVGQTSLFDEALGQVAYEATRLEEGTAATLDDVTARRDAYARLRESDAHRRATLVADTWCAAFVGERIAEVPITTGTVERFASSSLLQDDRAAILVRAAAERFSFFHWSLEFPQVFGQEGAAGFACVLGNPPWERVKLEERQFFAAAGRRDIATAANASHRKRMIERLEAADPVAVAFRDARRESDGVSHFLRNSGRFPLCGRGDVNTYAVFAEAIRDLRAGGGRAGCIVPSGIATDDTTKHFFGDLVARTDLVSLFDFRSNADLFGDIGHARFKFCLLTMATRPAATFVFFAERPEDVGDDHRRFVLTPLEFGLINPNTRTCPTFRSNRDAEITKAVYAHLPVLVRDGAVDGNPWGISFMSMFHMANDSGLFETTPRQGVVPLYEAKMAHQFTHRWATYAGDDVRPPTGDELANPSWSVTPRYWVERRAMEARLAGRWHREWLIGWRDITHPTNERTMVPAVVPRVGTGDTLLLAFPAVGAAAALLAALASFPLDYIARQKLGGIHLKYHVVRQLAVPAPEAMNAYEDWLASRVVELVATAWDVAAVADDHGLPGPPFCWNPDRRFWIRAELDAFFFHEYSIARADVEHIMDSFWIVREKDVKAHGSYRTKQAILAIYDDMARARRLGRQYETRLNPPPAHPSLRHPERTRPKEMV